MICFAVAVGKAGGVNTFFQILQGTVEVFSTPTRRLTYLQPLPLWRASMNEPEAVVHLQFLVMQP